MKTSKERLEWLIDFSKMEDIAKLKEWEWLKVKEEISEFISDQDAHYRLRLDSDEEPELTKELINRMRNAARMVLDDIANNPGGYKAGGAPIRVLNITSVWDGTEIVFTVTSRSHLFNMRMQLVLVAADTSRIQNCPECQTLFYKNRKQVYCSKLCTDRVARREWLKKPANRKKDAQWAHQRYERRQKASNPNVRVARRPRIKSKAKKGVGHGSQRSKERK